MSKRNDVCIVGGCGHVGLPLAIMLSIAGKNVCVYDKNTAAIEMIQKGIMPFHEEGAQPLLEEALKKGISVFLRDRMSFLILKLL